MDNGFTNKNTASEAGKKSRRGKSVKNKAWEQLGEFIINDGADKYLKIIEKLDDKEFMNEYKALLEFFKPKQARIETRGDEPNRLIVKSFNYKIVNAN